VLRSLTALATVGFAVGLAAHDTAITLIALCCLGAGCALVTPTTYSTVGETTSANPGRAVALVSGVGWVGFVAGPPVIGQIASATSLRFALTIIPVLTALITGLMIATGAFTTGSNGTPRAPLRPARSQRRTPAHPLTPNVRTVSGRWPGLVMQVGSREQFGPLCRVWDLRLCWATDGVSIRAIRGCTQHRRLPGEAAVSAD
jgi:MFS family permease